MAKSMYKLIGPDGATWEIRDNGGVVEFLKDDVPQGQGHAKTVSGAETLTSADNGKTIILDGTAGATVTLPSLADGLRFKVVVGSAFATSNWVIDSAEGDNISGVLVVNGASVIAAAEDQINFVASAETVGDYIELVADSGNSQWIVNGVGAGAGSITATDPS